MPLLTPIASEVWQNAAKSFFECRDRRTKNVLSVLQDSTNGGVDLGFQRAELRRQIDEWNHSQLRGLQTLTWHSSPAQSSAPTLSAAPRR